MKTISKASAREKAVASALASLRMEQLTPSAQVVKGMRSLVAGETTADKLIADITARHVAVRRG